MTDNQLVGFIILVTFVGAIVLPTILCFWFFLFRKPNQTESLVDTVNTLRIIRDKDKVEVICNNTDKPCFRKDLIIRGACGGCPYERK